MKEIWKPISGYEGYYEVSNIGRVKALDREVPTSDGLIKHLKERIMPLNKTNRGYVRVRLSKGKVNKKFFVHRLVATAFLNNPENKPCVNHKNGRRDDNNILNLEWCTHSENTNHAYTTGLMPRKRPNGGMPGLKNPASKRVQCLFTGSIMSIGEAANFLSLSRDYFSEMLRSDNKNWSGFIKI